MLGADGLRARCGVVCVVVVAVAVAVAVVQFGGHGG